MRDLDVGLDAAHEHADLVIGAELSADEAAGRAHRRPGSRSSIPSADDPGRGRAVFAAVALAVAVAGVDAEIDAVQVNGATYTGAFTGMSAACALPTAAEKSRNSSVFFMMCPTA